MNANVNMNVGVNVSVNVSVNVPQRGRVADLAAAPAPCHHEARVVQLVGEVKGGELRATSGAHEFAHAQPAGRREGSARGCCV